MLSPSSPSSADVVATCLAHIERSPLNAFISVDAEAARAAAASCDQVAARGGSLGALHGLPVAVKDLIDVAGFPTTAGSRQYLGQLARSDATVVRRLRAQGAVLLGKTNTHEFAYGSTGDNSHFGAVRNPHDHGRISGGSSSGSAAAVAAGLCAAALGTDTSASIRLPAALCGVVGMKPTHGLLPKTGVFELSRTLDHVGPLTRDVRANALLLEVLADQPGAFSRRIGRSVQGLRVARIERFYGQHLSDDVRQAQARAFEALCAAGAQVIELDLPEIDHIYQAQQTVLRAEAYATHHSAIEAGRFYSDEVLSRLVAGREVPAHVYLNSLWYRQQAIDSFDHVLDAADCILTATCGITAPPLYERRSWVEGVEMPTFQLLTRLTAPTNFSGHPSLSVPFGRSGGLPGSPVGLPIGLQLIGRWGDEATVYQVGRQLELAR